MMMRSQSSVSREKSRAFVRYLALFVILAIVHLGLVNRLHEVDVDQGGAHHREGAHVVEEVEDLGGETFRTTTTTMPPSPEPVDIPPPPRPYREEPSYSPSQVRPVLRRTTKAPLTTEEEVFSVSTTTTKMPAPTTTTTPSSLFQHMTPPVTAGEEMNAEAARAAFLNALDTFALNLHRDDVRGNPEQPTREFVNIEAEEGRGVPLPYDATIVELPERYEACDRRNASFSIARDELCQEYLSNLNNMRYIKAMPSLLLQGRTIKMKIYYAHADIYVIVKVSQRKFLYEAVSEFMAFSFDRVLSFNRVPTTVFVPLPLDYLRAAAAYSPLLSQWFHRYVVLYNYTNVNFETCTYPSQPAESDGLCSMVAIQLWMKDVHPALETFMALPYEYDEKFALKYFVPGHDQWSFTKKKRVRAVGELLDRFIFDFLIGNSDRGMNDHNNFVYGGCSEITDCKVERPEDRIYGLAKFAYLDQGSSLYSHKEIPENPFFGDSNRIKICRYRRSTYRALLPYRSTTRDYYPLVKAVDKNVPPAVYKVSHDSVIRKVQNRLDKILTIVERCLGEYPESEVFSMPEYDEVRIAEEDATLDE